MRDTAQDDERVTTLAELTLARPAGERERYLREACGADPDLFGAVWEYVEWEERMRGFLDAPLLATTAEHVLEVGEILEGRFRILREIAQGGMGIVYEAIDEKLDRRIALKCAKAGFGHRLPPEARNATTVSHPNVCKIHEIHSASRAGGTIEFLTMEFLDGETLAERLGRGPMAEPEARELAVQLCAGLAEAHRNLVFHGDLKSGNVILTKSADGATRAVITDFGLARKPDAPQHAAASGMLGGTADYMAPELWRGEQATIATDIYALGVLLRELVSGAPDVPGRWTRTVARCREADPARRFRNADEVAKALSPVSRRWMLGAAAAVVLAAASGVVAYERATAPQESIRLAVLPLEVDGDAAAVASEIGRSASSQLGRLRGGTRARLKIISPGPGATHVVHGIVSREEGPVVVHAFVTETQTQANAGDREFRYAPGEVRYAGLALAGLVSASLRLPPPLVAPVNAAAKQDYTAGLSYTRLNSTVDRAVESLERAVKADGDSPLTWAALAEAEWHKYFITREPVWLDRAAESLRQAQNRQPDVATIHRVAGLLLANNSLYEQAVAEYLRAIELEPENSDSYRRLGQAYERNNQLALALAALQKAVERDPTYLKVYQELGTYYTHRGDWANAILQFQKCVQLAPDEADSHYVLGTAYLNAGRYAEAEPELREAIRLGESPRALNNLAATLIAQEKDREAIPLLLRALERYPDRYLWWINLGNAYRKTGSPRDAESAYRRSLELAEKEIARDPRDGGVRSGVAYLCARLGDRKRAASEAAQALRQSAQSVETLRMVVWTYELLDNRQAALAVLKDAPPKQRLDEIVSGSDLAELRQDPRFKELMKSRRMDKEEVK